MPDLNPTIAGRLRQSLTQTNTTAWEDGQPDQDSTCGLVGTSDGHQNGAIYLLDGYFASTYTLTDIRCLVMSFDTSAITSAPDSATLKVYGKGTFTTTGDPTSDSTNGIVGLKTTLGATPKLWGIV